jgi:hypothetical protein
MKKETPRLHASFAKKSFERGQSSRIRAHLLGNKSAVGVTACKGVIPDNVVDKLVALETEKTREEQRKRSCQQLEIATSAPAGEPTLTQPSLAATLQRGNYSEVHRVVARAFYANGMSFNIARNPFWKDAVKATAGAGPNYKPPGYEALRTHMLEKKKEDLDRQLDSLLAEEILRSGCTITSDGWTNITNKPLLNVLIITPKGERFLAAVDTSGQIKPAEYIAGELIKVIELVNEECLSFEVQ